MKKRKKTSKKKHIILIIIGILFLVIVFLTTLKIENVTYEGNIRLTEEELTNQIFGDSYNTNPILFLIKSFFSEKVEIPFVEDYDIDINSLSSVNITVYEKSVVGYITYMDTYMYFDKDGIVVENLKEKYEDVPEVTGIQFSNIVLHSPIPVKNTKVFDLILDVTQLINKYNLNVYSIRISDAMEVTLYINSFRVNLGTSSELSNKIAALSDIIPSMEDIPGELNMKEYNDSGYGYIFKKSSE